ncbi:glycosyltransferase [Rhodococcoides yunnanense]|uniref:glycosyltransferase n=1 Tax=Rhodococcoides yunnanense TaxID=278209 RepID=UPI0009325C2F|nr:glycosyltransferase [Rhodococcus yunnanensis]
MRGRHTYVVVGPGFRFQSGISVYTHRLADALSAYDDASVLLLRRLIPRHLYPGAARVGSRLTDLHYPDNVPVLAELDWYWGPTMVRALRALRRARPDAIVLQWWTAATLHSYLVLALVARWWRIRVIVEFHEVQDTGEADIGLVARYCHRAMPLLLRLTDAALVHNRHDLSLLRRTYGGDAIDRLRLEMAPHGPYDHLVGDRAPARRDGSVTRLLFFGLIRPYKGLEDLIRAFGSMTEEEVEQFHLTVVGETWENWSLPAELIAASPYRHRITFVDRYVDDGAVRSFFASADALVLPYRRGSASGPMQIAMSGGMHVVVYAVGGLRETAAEYEGAVLVPPDDIDSLRAALLQLPPRREMRFADPSSWSTTVSAYDRLVRRA